MFRARAALGPHPEDDGASPSVTLFLQGSDATADSERHLVTGRLARFAGTLYTSRVKRLVLILVALLVPLMLVVGLAVYAYYTPQLALRELNNAARHGDTGTLERLIDFPAVRESLKQQVQERLSKSTSNSQSPLAAFGTALAGAVAAPAVDTMVTPDNVARLLRGETFGPSAGPTLSLDSRQLEMHYENLDRFEVTSAPPPDGFELILERDGWLDWRLVDVRLPASWVLPGA